MMIYTSGRKIWVNQMRRDPITTSGILLYSNPKINLKSIAVPETFFVKEGWRAVLGSI
jgi:hypothetical protein